MPIVLIIFSITLIAVFAAVMLATSPSTKEKVISRRLGEALDPHKSSKDSASIPGSGLPLIDPESSKSPKNILGNVALHKFLRRLIAQSHSAISVKTVAWMIVLLAGVACSIAWFLTSTLPIALAAGVACGALPIVYLYHRRRKWMAAFSTVLPECIDTFSRSLKAGQSVVASFDIVAQQVPAPADITFGEVFKKQRYGLPLREALYQMVEQVPSMDLKIMVTAILVQRETGGNLPHVLDRLSAVIRDRVRIRNEIKIQTAQGRMTGWILGLLPPLVMLGMNWISPHYSAPFFDDPIGRYLLYACAILLITGFVVIQRMVSGIEV